MPLWCVTMVKINSKLLPIKNTKSTSNQEIYSCDYINDCNTYSASEVFTGKYSDENKPIYRKVFTGTIGTTGNTTALTDIPKEYSVESINGRFYNTSNGDTRPLTFVINYQGTMYYMSCLLSKATTYYQLNFWYSTDYSSQNYKVTIEYTKNS